MITRKEFLETKIEDCQKAIWWNEIVLERQKELNESKDKLDATAHAIETDKDTIKKLQDEISKE